MIEFIAILRLIIATQTAKEHAPIFQGWNMFLDIDNSMSANATKFAVGTRGNVGSIPDGRPEHGEYLRSKVEFI